MEFSRFDPFRGPRNLGTPAGSFFPQIPIPIQAFPYAGRPVMPSRRQIGGRSSVRRWFGAVEVPPGSQSSHFPVLGRSRLPAASSKPSQARPDQASQARPDQASQASDGRLGFEGKVPKMREGCLRQRWPSRGESERVNPSLYHIYVRTPHAGRMIGE